MLNPEMEMVERKHQFGSREFQFPNTNWWDIWFGYEKCPFWEDEELGKLWCRKSKGLYFVGPQKRDTRQKQYQKRKEVGKLIGPAFIVRAGSPRKVRFLGRELVPIRNNNLNAGVAIGNKDGGEGDIHMIPRSNLTRWTLGITLFQFLQLHTILLHLSFGLRTKTLPLNLSGCPHSSVPNLMTSYPTLRRQTVPTVLIHIYTLFPTLPLLFLLPFFL